MASDNDRDWVCAHGPANRSGRGWFRYAICNLSVTDPFSELGGRYHPPNRMLKVGTGDVYLNIEVFSLARKVFDELGLHLSAVISSIFTVSKDSAPGGVS